MKLHHTELVSLTLLSAPLVHPVSGKLPLAVTTVREPGVWQTSSLTLTPKLCPQGDESDVVTSEISVGPSALVGVAVSDSTPDHRFFSSPDTGSVVHVRHPEEDSALRTNRDDLDIFYFLPFLSCDQPLAAHLNTLIFVGPSSPSQIQAFLILGFSVDFLK